MRPLAHGQSRAVAVQHYENFPVASWLCPPKLRPPIVAIYHFARTADDIADEGDQPAGARQRELAAYRNELWRVASLAPPTPRWASVFQPLARAIEHHHLPTHLLDDLLDAFTQDTGNPVYVDRAELLDYCRRSANPIGRLLLHLYGITDTKALDRSDAICSALQLINFWQDFSVDHPRGRCYLPRSDAERFGVDLATLRAGQVQGKAAQAMLTDLLDWTEGLMRSGAPLVHQLPGRAGWELRLVVQGGLRVLEKIRAMNPASFSQRPTLKPLDLPLLLWRALKMSNQVTTS
jgi:squalene synthase HpnC